LRHRIASAFLALALPVLSTPSARAEVFTPVEPPRAVALREVITAPGPLTSVTHAGDARLFLTLRDGRVLILQNGAFLRKPFLDLRGKVGLEGEGGLLSIAFHPRYAENGLFFVASTARNRSVILSRYQVSRRDPNRADPATLRVLLTIRKTTPLHNGGQLHFGPDGYLYVSLGDGARGRSDVCDAQRDDTLLGKILRLDVDTGADRAPFYSIPPDNPFRGVSGKRGEIWATGLRNPWRFSFDRATGDLYIGDVGNSQREEIDFLPAGSPGGVNYGWKVMEGTTCFREAACPATTPPCNSPLYTPPILEYPHDDVGCSVTGGYVYRGTRLPQLYGAYVFGDFCAGRLWSAEREAVEGAWEVRDLPARAPVLTAFGEDRAGEIYAATLNGKLFQLVSPNPVDTVGLFDQAAARFLFRDLHLAGPANRALRFGTPGAGSLPLAGDWNGDGLSTPGLYDPATGGVQIKNSISRSPVDVTFLLTAPAGAAPVTGDWNGDGRDSVGVFDESTSTFFLRNALSAGLFDVTLSFGPAAGGRLPIAGDWNGDGRDTVGLYDPATGTFFLKNTLTGTATDLELEIDGAGADWLPLAGDWDGDGRDSAGLYDPATATFHLKNKPESGPADLVFQFGTPGGGRMPVAGEW
jgi:glucose/arabinose dehydrogenase